MSYREFFKTLTGFDPHPYQERVGELLRSGNSAILRVPTGAGKTWAAVAPFLYSIADTERSADRLLYALPLRSLASSLHAGVLERMAALGPVSATGNNREYGDGSRYCSLQIGGQRDDVFFHSDAVFTTIDQLLSGYVFLPVSLPDRLGNINAGALVGSVVVFDEIHLLDSSIALGTMIEMLDRLRGLCQFVLMTATTSDRAIAWLANRLGAVTVSVEDREIRALPSQRSKRRSWRWSEDELDASTVAAQHTGARTIVLLNSVRKAQDVFLALERYYEGRPDKPLLMLLHARFYPEDRQAVEAQLHTYFGPGATGNNVILVTTQVIEAGMDVSADQLHCELAPMNALVQRAGRTARYEHRPAGRVTVYEVSGLGPYTEDKPLVESTRRLLQALPQEGRAVDFVEERLWIETVHADAEVRALRSYDSLQARRDEVHRAMDQGDRGRLNGLIRDIDSVSVIVTAEPEALFEKRAWPRLLSVPARSLMSLRSHFDNLGPERWVAKGAVEIDSDERPGVTLRWVPLGAGQIRAQWLVAIHPDFATYHPRLGLRLGASGPAPTLVFSAKPPAQQFDYQLESWAKHCKRIVVIARAMQNSSRRGMEVLAAKYGVTQTWIEDLVALTCVLHDVGKLAIGWQEQAWRWQDDKDARARAAGIAVPTRSRVPIAHTWFESGTDRAFKRGFKFPPHAAEGALAVRKALTTRLRTLGNEDWAELAAKCAATAIARHHGTRTRECSLFRFPSEAAGTVKGAIPNWPELVLTDCADVLTKSLFSEGLLTFGIGDDEETWPLYAFLVRHLRLADQAATADASRECLWGVTTGLTNK